MAEPDNEPGTQQRWDSYAQDDDSSPVRRKRRRRQLVVYTAVDMAAAALVVTSLVIYTQALNSTQKPGNNTTQPADTRNTVTDTDAGVDADTDTVNDAEPDPTSAHRTSPNSEPQTTREPATTTTTLHPHVQTQGTEQVNAIIDRYAEAWPWTAHAAVAAQISFYENLPEKCASTVGCYNHTTGEIWFSLDALRPHEPSPYDYFYGTRGTSDIVLHELAHAYTRTFPQGTRLLGAFTQHYAGCHGHGLHTTQFAAELLADTMAMVATSAGSRLPDDYGYFGSGGFAGCLTESNQPDLALILDVYATLFNCGSEHALEVFDNHHNPSLFGLTFGTDFDDNAGFDADAVLLFCYSIDCVTTDRGCVNLAENDARRDLAANRLFERRCADGVLESVTGSEHWRRDGWEPGCDAFIPDDVECTVYGTHGVVDGYVAGLLTTANECVVPNCDVENSQENPQRGYREYSWNQCEAIDRPAHP